MSKRSSDVKVSYEVSIRTTLLRTAGLVGLTVLFAFLFRYVGFLSYAVQKIAGSDTWQSLYALLHIDTALGREQLILVGIMLACFMMALVVQGAFVIVSGRLRR